jgi:hypothetical protein
VILPTAEALAERRRGFIRRTPLGLLALALIIAAAVLPHILVIEAMQFAGRSLISVSRFFVTAGPGGTAFVDATSPNAVGFGITVTYLGLALQQVGSVLGIGTFWVLIAEDVGRWVRRGALAAGVMLVVSSATVITGYRQLLAANVPTDLGIAWLPTVLAGLTLVLGAQLAKARLDSTWFMTKPELFQP